jgi:hypothetical protein
VRFTDKVYKGLKFIALVLLPALGTAYFTISDIWHLPDAQQVVGTITVVDTFLGVVLHLSTASYNNSADKYDGEFAVVQNTDGSQNLKLLSIDPAVINGGNKTELIFKIQPGVISAAQPGD